MTVFALTRKVLLTRACLLILAGPTGFASLGQTQDATLEQARTAMRQGKVSRAISLLRPWVAGHPRDITARLMLGDAFRTARHPRQAEAEFEAVLKLAPGNFAALMELGSLYVETGRLELAEPLLAR